MTPREIMDHLMRGDAPLRELMMAARKERKAMGPLFVDLVTQLGFRSIREMEAGEINALLPSLFLLGEWREPFVYRPALYAQPLSH